MHTGQVSPQVKGFYLINKIFKLYLHINLYLFFSCSLTAFEAQSPDKIDTYFEARHSEVQFDKSSFPVAFNDSASKPILDAHSLRDISDTGRQLDESVFLSNATIKINCY